MELISCELDGKGREAGVKLTDESFRVFSAHVHGSESSDV